RCRADLPAEPSTGEAVEFVTALWKLAEGFELEGRFDDAQQANQEAMAVGRSLHERDPSMQSGTLLGGSLEREANRIRIEDREEEERLLRDWVDLTGEIVAAHPHDAVSGANRVLALLALADNLERDGISEEAVTLLLDAHAFQVEVVARDSTTENLRRLAAVVLGLAEAALRQRLVEK